MTPLAVLPVFSLAAPVGSARGVDGDQDTDQRRGRVKDRRPVLKPLRHRPGCLRVLIVIGAFAGRAA